MGGMKGAEEMGKRRKRRIFWRGRGRNFIRGKARNLVLTSMFKRLWAD
jgi:hypothetical protein